MSSRSRRAPVHFGDDATPLNIGRATQSHQEYIFHQSASSNSSPSSKELNDHSVGASALSCAKATGSCEHRAKLLIICAVVTHAKQNTGSSGQPRSCGSTGKVVAYS